MVREPINSEKIIVKYKDSIILPKAKKSGLQERGIETRKLKGDQTLALTIQNRYHRGSSIQTLEQELLLKTSKQKIDKRNLSTKIDKGETVVETNPEQGLPAERIQGGDISDKDPNEANLENLDSVQ